MRPTAPKPIGTGKKKPTRPPAVKLRGKPVPLATYKPKRAPGSPVPVPMPTRVPNLSLPRDQRAKAKPMPSGPKKKSPGVVITPKPKAKKPTLNDFLSKGKRPPIKPGFKLPSDADVTLKGYNDKKTLNKYKKK